MQVRSIPDIIRWLIEEGNIDDLYFHYLASYFRWDRRYKPSKHIKEDIKDETIVCQETLIFARFLIDRCGFEIRTDLDFIDGVPSYRVCTDEFDEVAEIMKERALKRVNTEYYEDIYGWEYFLRPVEKAIIPDKIPDEIIKLFEAPIVD